MSTNPTSSSESSEPVNEPEIVSEGQATNSTYDPKVVGIVAYITFIGWIVALIMNNPKSDHGSFHIRQSLGIMLLFLASAFVFLIPFIGWIIGMVAYIAAFVFWIIGLIGAVQGTKNPVPLIGEKSQEWFQAL